MERRRGEGLDEIPPEREATEDDFDDDVADDDFVHIDFYIPPERVIMIIMMMIDYDHGDDHGVDDDGNVYLAEVGVEEVVSPRFSDSNLHKVLNFCLLLSLSSPTA